jgi:hypothetical protein
MTSPALDLTLALTQSCVSQLESVKVTVTLTNHGPVTVVPSAYDISGALVVTVRAGERVVRRASGLTQQELMIRGRINATPSLEELEPNAHWTAALDLGQSMYSPPPGQYRVVAELELPDGARVTSNEVELEVTREAVLAARAQRNNPVLDGLSLLLTRDKTEAPFLLRQYNHAKPLGSWYCEGLPIAEAVIVAHPTYFATDSFDHFFERWIVFRDGENVVAAHFMNGKPTGARLEAPLPASARLLPVACDHGAGRIELFTVEGDLLVALAFTQGALNERFRVRLPAGIERGPEVVGDRSGYWLAVANAGLLSAHVDPAGSAEPWLRRFNSDLSCEKLSIDPVDGRVTAAFWDAPTGRHLQLLEAELASDRVNLLYIERKGALEDLEEFGFDRDERGAFHLLAHGKDGLFYQRHDGAPLWLAPRAPRRAPLVSARPAVHLGFYDAERGYHFYHFKNGVLYRDPEPELPESA